SQRGGYRGNYRGRGGNRGNSGSGGRGGKKGGSFRGGKKDRNPDFDPNKYCTRHEAQGHDLKHCRTAAREKELEKQGVEEGSNGTKQSDRTYQPNFSRAYPMSAKVTRLIANTTEIELKSDPNKWIVDSAANA